MILCYCAQVHLSNTIGTTLAFFIFIINIKNKCNFISIPDHWFHLNVCYQTPVQAHLSELLRGLRKLDMFSFSAQILRENSSNSPRTCSSHSTATACSTGMELKSSSWSPALNPVASIPMISSACSTVQQSTGLSAGWNSQGCSLLVVPEHSPGRNAPFIALERPRKDSCLSWVLFRLPFSPFKLLHESWPFLVFLLEESIEVSKEEHIGPGFLSSSPTQAVTATGCLKAEL